MDLTLVVQAGPDTGPVKIITSKLENASRQLHALQAGNAHTLRVISALRAPVSDILEAAADHRIQTDWHHPAALDAINRQTNVDGIADVLNIEHDEHLAELEKRSEQAAQRAREEREAEELRQLAWPGLKS